MEVDRRQVIFLEEKLAKDACAVKAAVADSGAWYAERSVLGRATGISTGKLKIRGRLPNVGKGTDALHTEASQLKGLAGGEKSVIAATGGQSWRTVVRTEQGHGIASAVIFGMAHHFQADLIVCDTKSKTRERSMEAIIFRSGLEVVVGVNTGNAGQGQD